MASPAGMGKGNLGRGNHLTGPKLVGSPLHDNVGLPKPSHCSLPQYLGSMLIKDLRGTESTQDACAKMRKSTEHMKKIPTIILSITYKGVKFIDASNKNVIAEHEIRNISCAAQDPEDLCTFAYITKDLQTSHHYCHVFSTVDVVSGVLPRGPAGRGLDRGGLSAVLC